MGGLVRRTIRTVSDGGAERVEQARASEGRRLPRLEILAIALTTVFVVAVASVGVLLMSRGPGRASYTGPVSGIRYTVTTTLMAAKGGPLNACFATPLPYPPIGCGGVEVTNVDVSIIVGATTYPNGTLATPPLRLVGAWDGHVLRLTEAPQPAKAGATEPQPVAQAPPASSAKSTLDVLQELRRDNSKLQQRGIDLLEWGEGVDGVELTL